MAYPDLTLQPSFTVQSVNERMVRIGQRIQNLDERGQLDIKAIASQTGTGTRFVMDTNPALIGPTTDTLQTSGNVGIGIAPSAVNGRRLTVEQDGNQVTKTLTKNADAAAVGAAAVTGVEADVAVTQISAFGSAFPGTFFGLNLAGQSSVNNGGSGTVGMTFGTVNAIPVRIGTNGIAAVIINATTQVVTVLAPIILKGYTVATLPAGTVGMRAYVTDAAAPAYGAAVVGGGAVTAPVFFDGVWRTM